VRLVPMPGMYKPEQLVQRVRIDRVGVHLCIADCLDVIGVPRLEVSPRGTCRSRSQYQVAVDSVDRGQDHRTLAQIDARVQDETLLREMAGGCSLETLKQSLLVPAITKHSFTGSRRA
jgi:hypothetical protein